MKPRITMRRERQKGHGVRRTVMAVGALGAATAGYRRWRHRHHDVENFQA